MQKLLEFFIPGLKLFLICAVAAVTLGFINEITEPIIIETRDNEEKEALNVLFAQEEWVKITAAPFSLSGEYFERYLLDKAKTKEEKKFLVYCYDFDGNNDEYLLKKDLSLSDREKLGKLFADLGYKPQGPVMAYYPVEQNSQIVGYALDLLGSGYGGDMKIIAGYNNDGSIKNVKLLDNSETPGLGKKAEAEGYMDKFIGTGAEKPVPVIKNMLPNQKEIDAVTGATITFMAIADVLRAGSDFMKKIEVHNE
jgi:RnfABCDGE-type electron transport complex G subunit